MKPIFRLMIISMSVAFFSVNAFSHDAKVDARHDDFLKLVQHFESTGEEGDLTPELSALIGAQGTLLVKGRDFTVPTKHGKEYRECGIVYSDAPDKHPLFSYLNRQIVTGTESESYWLRVSLDGQLVSASILHGKYDHAGKAITGSGTSKTLDIKSRAVQKAYREEMAYWINWLNREPAPTVVAGSTSTSPSKQ